MLSMALQLNPLFQILLKLLPHLTFYSKLNFLQQQATFVLSTSSPHFINVDLPHPPLCWNCTFDLPTLPNLTQSYLVLTEWLLICNSRRTSRSVIFMFLPRKINVSKLPFPLGREETRSWPRLGYPGLGSRKSPEGFKQPRMLGMRVFSW